MVEALQRWILENYAKLWAAFKDARFNFDEAAEVVKDNRRLPTILSRLQRGGWLNVEKNPSDRRKKTYRLEDPRNIFAKLGGG